MGAWTSVTPADQRAITARRREQERARVLAKEADHRHVLELRDNIHVAARIQHDTVGRFEQLRRGAAPVTPDEVDDCWYLMALTLDCLREAEADYCAAAGLEYASIDGGVDLVFNAAPTAAVAAATVTPITARWPEPITAAALHGIPGEYAD